MKPILASVLLAVVVAIFATAIFAVPPKGTQVTVAVQGFHCQPCPDSLVTALAKLPGVTEVTGTLKPARVTARLDEAKMTVSQFVAAINAQPTAMDPKKTYTARLTVFVDSAATAGEERMCPSCAKEISKALLAIKGINGVKSDDTGKVVTIGFTSTAKVTTAAIAKALASTKSKFTTAFTDPNAGKEEAAAGDHCSGGACPMMGGR
ncbi:MAG: Heavy-metal-associated domain protein [bacterium ADurb.Bin429]|nr:MAG: Heavy-metal-associated domain protein [bacterium ADurb.Bin429]